MISGFKNKKRIVIVVSMIALGIASYFVIRYFLNKERYVRTPPAVSRDIVGEAGNMSFVIKGIEVPLKNGTATVDGLPGIVKIMSKSLEIDFNNDKRMDRAVIIKNEREDGSVYFYASVVIIGESGTLTNTNTIFLGEGALIQRMIELPNNMFSVEYLDRKNPKESPTLKKKKTFKVDGYVLEEVEKK